MKKRNSTVELEKTWLERQQNTGTPLSLEEIEFLENIKAFIDFGIRNGFTFMVMAATIAHDVNEFARDGFDIQAALKRGFHPKVSGYAELNADSPQSGEDD